MICVFKSNLSVSQTQLECNISYTMKMEMWEKDRLFQTVDMSEQVQKLQLHFPVVCNGKTENKVICPMRQIDSDTSHTLPCTWYVYMLTGRYNEVVVFFTWNQRNTASESFPYSPNSGWPMLSRIDTYTKNSFLDTRTLWLYRIEKF